MCVAHSADTQMYLGNGEKSTENFLINMKHTALYENDSEQLYNRTVTIFPIYIKKSLRTSANSIPVFVLSSSSPSWIGPCRR